MAENQSTQQVAVKSQVADKVIARINNLQENGFVLPKDFSVVNAIKSSLMIIEDLKDKNKRPALQVCSQNSIAKALFEMATKGLSANKAQCYFIIRGNELQMQESYFGKILRVKRIFPNFDPIPRVIYEGDEFVYETDIMTGRRKLVKHEQKLENLDKPFIGAYMYIPTQDGGEDLYVMTKKMIMTAWSKSSNPTQATHKQFTDKMVGKTIINSACTMLINSTPEFNEMQDEYYNSDEDNIEVTQATQPINFEDADIVEDVEEEKDEPMENSKDAFEAHAEETDPF